MSIPDRCKIAPTFSRLGTLCSLIVQVPMAPGAGIGVSLTSAVLPLDRSLPVMRERIFCSCPITSPMTARSTAKHDCRHLTCGTHFSCVTACSTMMQAQLSLHNVLMRRASARTSLNIIHQLQWQSGTVSLYTLLYVIPALIVPPGIMKVPGLR